MSRARKSAAGCLFAWGIAASIVGSSLAEPPSEPSPSSSGVLVVDVAGVPSPGTLYLELYDAAQPDWGTPLRREHLAVERGSAQWRIEALPPGEYAVRVFLDQNGNGTLDRSRKGLPREPFGFSNDARRRLGMPRIRAAAFRFDTDERRVAIQLVSRAEAPSDPAPPR